TAAGPRAIHVRLGVRLAHGAPAGIAPGAWVRTAGEFERLQGRRNPGGPDLSAAPLGRGIRLWQRVRDPAGVQLLRRASWPARAGLRMPRARERRLLGRRSCWPLPRGPAILPMF